MNCLFASVTQPYRRWKYIVGGYPKSKFVLIRYKEISGQKMKAIKQMRDDRDEASYRVAATIGHDELPE